MERSDLTGSLWMMCSLYSSWILLLVALALWIAASPHEAEIDRAIEIILATAKADPRGLKDPAPEVYIPDFGP